MMPYLKIFKDNAQVVDMLTDEEAGKLYKAILHYGEDQDELQGREALVFAMLKQQFERDAAAYEKRIKTQSENGKKGGRPKKPEVTEETQEKPSVSKKPKQTQKSQDKDKDKDKDNNITPLKSPQGDTWTYLLDESVHESFKDFIDSRKKLRSPMTPKAMTMMAEKLNKLTGDPKQQIDLLNEAIEKGWKSVYPHSTCYDKKKPALDYIQKKYDDAELLGMAVDLDG